MESPSWQSMRTGAALEITSVVPPDASEGLREETTGERLAGH
jgi:hypothetical protein